MGVHLALLFLTEIFSGVRLTVDSLLLQFFEDMHFLSTLIFYVTLLSIASSSSSSSPSDGLLIGAFNVQIFGQKKSANQEVMQHLVRVKSFLDQVRVMDI